MFFLRKAVQDVDAIRHADAEFNRLYGYEAHGGLIDNGRVVTDCMARLVGVIETTHAVTPEQIVVARGERSRLFDTAAAVSSSSIPVRLRRCRGCGRRLPPQASRWKT